VDEFHRHLLFDGLEYLQLAPTPTILDNLLHEGKIPPLVAVLLESLGQTRNRDYRVISPLWTS
jgi:enterochelin esterase-like enzyme